MPDNKLDKPALFIFQWNWIVGFESHYEDCPFSYSLKSRGSLTKCWNIYFLSRPFWRPSSSLKQTTLRQQTVDARGSPVYPTWRLIASVRHNIKINTHDAPHLSGKETTLSSSSIAFLFDRDCIYLWKWMLQQFSCFLSDQKSLLIKESELL